MTRIGTWMWLGIAIPGAGCDYPATVPPHGSVDAAADVAPDDVAPDGAAEAAVTWHRDLRPIVEQRCNGCHASGGIAPLVFDDPAQVEAAGPLMVPAVLNGVMPPWPMDPSCRDVRDARVLGEEEKAVFAGWRDAGFAMGDPADYVALPPLPKVTLGQEGLALTRTQGYSPSLAVSDDYRCFLFQQAIQGERWIRGAEIKPDEQPLVHHVLLFMVPAEAAPGLEALDAQTPDVAGYPCEGGSGAAADTLIAGWVPGSQPLLFPEKAAIQAPAGSRFVAQMHYNTTNADPGAPVPGDTTGGWLELLPSSDTPSHAISMRPIVDTQLSIAAGATGVVEGATFTARAEGQIVGTTPHMHTRGSEIRVHAKNASGAETCVADIPEWDFHWQQTYIFEPSSYVPVAVGDKVSIECVYDNSAANQPLVGGVRQPPALLKWGEGTDDEMCLAYLVVMTPFDATPAPVCQGFGACYAECDAGDAVCAGQCLIAEGNPCAQCGVDSLFKTCARAHCPSQTQALATCLAGCQGNKLQCAMTDCRQASGQLYACLEPPLRAGSCDGECGIEVVP